MKKIFLLFFLLSLLFPKFSHAQQEAKLNFTVSKIESKTGKLIEKITLLTKFSPESKVDYHLYLLEKRLAELVYSVEINNIDLVEPTASRYSTYLGITTEYAAQKKVTNKKEVLLNTLERHEKILTKTQEKFEHDSGWWLAVQHGINNTRNFREKVKSI